jgi:anti-anti-sigma factor
VENCNTGRALTFGEGQGTSFGRRCARAVQKGAALRARRPFPNRLTVTCMATKRKDHRPDFAVSIEPGGHDDELMVVARGEVDLLTAPMLADELDDAIGKRPETLVVDLAGVTFLDSSGCNSLVRAKRRAAVHAVALELARLSPPCRRVFEIAGLVDLFTIRE